MNLKYRLPVLVLAAMLLVAAASTYRLLYPHGIREDWAPFDRIRGPQRFRQYVADPIPPGIHDIRSVRTQRGISIDFRYSGDIEAYGFLSNWGELRSYDTTASFVPELLMIGANRVYGQRTGNRDCHILIAEDRKRGMLVCPD